MYGKAIILVFVGAVLGYLPAAAQIKHPRPAQKILTHKLRGEVLSAINKQPVAGANITIKGTTRGVAAKGDGRFAISINHNEVVVITAIGYKKQEINYKGQSFLTVYLEPDVKKLLEMVVVGYGSEKKKNIIGSVSSIKGEDLAQSSAVSFDNALAGKAAGVLVNSSSGVPGSATSITIRGISSLTGDSNNPLIVIDGVPVYGTGKDLNTSDFSQSSSPLVGFGGTSAASGYKAPQTFERNPLANLNPDDIASIQILKDAYATSIYGSRGAAGVIIVTTKKGSRSQARVNVGYSTGLTQPTGKYDLLDGAEYAQIYNKYYKNLGYHFPADQNTDWQNLVTRTAVSHKMNFSASGGSDDVTYYLSGSYLDQPAYIINQDFDRYTGRANINYDASKKVKFGSNVSISFTDNQALNSQTIYRDAVLHPTNIPVRKDDGSFDYSTGGNSIGEQFVNPVAEAQNKNSVKDTRVLGNAFLKYDPVTWLTFKSEFGVDLYNSKAGTRRYAIPGSLIPEGEGIETLTLNRKLVLNNTAKTKFTLASEHRFDITLGQSFESSTQDIASISSSSFPDNDIISIGGSNPNPANGSATRLIRQANQNQYALVSYFTRANYEFKDKYLAGFTYRIDGSSRFSRNKRYVGFPAFSLGWRISNEPFMENVTFVNDLKLRGSLGLTGINSNAQRSYYGNLGQYKLSPDKQYGDLGVITVVQPPNPNLKWQRKQKYDVGLDFTLFNSSLDGTIDYYYEKTTDMLYTSLIPTYFGYSAQEQNIGDLMNEGVELSLHYNKNWANFQWSTRFNIATNRNRIVNLNFENSSYTYTQQGEQVFREGQSATNLYLYQWKGVDPQTGNPLWRDAQGNITDSPPANRFIEEDDVNINRKSYGDSRPDFYGGLTNTFNYKGVELSAYFSFSYGNKMIDGSRASLLTYSTADAHNLSKYILNYWRIQGQQTPIPKLDNASITTSGSTSDTSIRDYTVSRNSSRFLEDASYLRLKTITVGYSLPPDIIHNYLHIRKARFYVKGTNLWTLTNYSGIDPEVSAFGSSALQAGRDELTLPQPKMYEVGVDIGF